MSAVPMSLTHRAIGHLAAPCPGLPVRAASFVHISCSGIIRASGTDWDRFGVASTGLLSVLSTALINVYKDIRIGGRGPNP